MNITGIKRNKNKNDEVIANGLILTKDASFDTEPRFKTLLMKGFIVYLVVMGSMGCLLSSFKIPYDAIVIHLAVFAGSLFSAFLYYTKVWENLGYFVLFALMLFTALLLRKYISSGFFAVVNIISEKAAYYFDTEVVQGYAESIGNRGVSVTIAMMYVGWVHAILLNALISRQMKYFAVMFCSFFFLTVPFYLECEPDMLYILMLLAGCIIVFVFRGARHTPLTKDDRRFEYVPKKRYINYVYSVKHHITMVVTLCLLVALFGGIFQMFVHKYDFETTARGRSAWKESTHDTVENIYKNGIWGFFNKYDSTGGLKGGVLGGVNSVTLDYETDLEVTYVPYSAERVYLRTFTGGTYMPYDNRWMRAVEYGIDKHEKSDGVTEYSLTQVVTPEETTSKTAGLLKEKYEKGEKGYAKASMIIKNIAANLGTFLPYYVDEQSRPEILMMSYRQERKVNYYPWISDPGPVKQEKKEKTVDKDIQKKLGVKQGYLSVPKENLEAIDKTIASAGLKQYKNDPNKLLKAIADYYQQNLPYTYQPGVTPRGTDFINYFLMDNKRGYCAHFASAATLILRRLGYQARYIEGYAIDPTDLNEDAKVRTDLNVRDYYDGDSKIDPSKRQVVTVNVTDAMAHAWVEVLIDGHWKVAELTPWSDEKPPSGGFLQGLIDFLSGSSIGSSNSDSITDGGLGDGAGLDALGRVFGYGIVILFSVAAVIIIIVIVIRTLSGRIRYIKAGNNDKLVMDMHRASKKTSDGINYRDRIRAMRENERLNITDDEADELIHILEQAGFSDVMISDDDYRRAKNMLKNK